MKIEQVINANFHVFMEDFAQKIKEGWSIKEVNNYALFFEAVLQKEDEREEVKKLIKELQQDTPKKPGPKPKGGV